MKKKSLRVVVSAAVLCAGVISTQAVRADACSPNAATMLPVSSSGRPLEFFGHQISRSEMARLWSITTTQSDAYLYLGKIIGEGHGWFETCQFPGLGIVTGSGGGDWRQRYVALWVWADSVTMSIARSSIYGLISDVVTTTTTTTTTLPPESTTTTTTSQEVPVTLGLSRENVKSSTAADFVATATTYAPAAAVLTLESSAIRVAPPVQKKKTRLKIARLLKKSKDSKRDK